MFGFHWILWFFWTTVSSDLSWFLRLHLLFPPISQASVFQKALALQSGETVLEPDGVTVTEWKTEQVTWDVEMFFHWDGSAVLFTSGAWKHQLRSLKRAKKKSKSQSLSLLDDSHCFLSLFRFLHSCLLAPLHSCASKRAQHAHTLQWVLLTWTTNLKYWFWHTDIARTFVTLKHYACLFLSWEI